MVSITKWIIIGAGMIMLGLFTKEASQTSLTGTLHRTGMAGGSIGSALSGVGSGVGDLFRGLFTPLWEVGNFAKSFGFGSDYWANSTPDPKAEYQRIELTGQGGGFTDAQTQGGGDPGVNTDPVSDSPNWFGWYGSDEKNNSPLGIKGIQATPGSIFNVGGSNIQTSIVHGQSLPLSQEARNYYQNIGVDVSGTVQSEPTGGGSNNTTGGGGGAGSGVSFSSSGHSGSWSGGGFGAAN